MSDSEKVEYKFGQENSKDGGLFPKGWQPLYQGDNEEQESQQTPAPRAQARTASPTVVPKARQAAPIINQPAQATSAAMPTPMTMPTPAAQANPQVTATANSVLARFGINK